MKIWKWITMGIMGSITTISALAYDVATQTAVPKAQVVALALSQTAGQKAAEAAAIGGIPTTTILIIGAGALAVWYYTKK